MLRGTKNICVSCVLLLSRCLSLCYIQVTDFTDKVNFYIMNAVTFFKSMWSQVKANAALLVGEDCVRSLYIVLYVVYISPYTALTAIANNHAYLHKLH